MLFKVPERKLGTKSCTKMDPQTSKIEAGGRAPIGLWDQKSSKFRSCVLLWLLGGLGGVLGASWGRFRSVLGRLGVVL